MKPKLPQRKNLRLQEYDYSQPGAYFITICTHNGMNSFGEVKDGEVCLNALGMISESEILNVAPRYDNVQIDKFVVMPNHVHMIVVIKPTERINPLPIDYHIKCNENKK